MQDYTFLERVNDFADRSNREGGDGEETPSKGRRDPRQKTLDRIAVVARLKSLQALPGSFSRARANRTHLVRADEATSTEDGEPEERSARRQRTAWTIELLELPAEGTFAAFTQKQTLHGVLDSRSLATIVPEEATACFVKEEASGSRATWHEIERRTWGLALSRHLEGRCLIEFPSIAYGR